jgi:3-dehydroquinate dehydratase-2
MRISIINGPNLNMLGKRQLSIYGNTSLEEINGYINNYAKKNDINVEFYQSNIEGEIINKIWQSSGNFDGIIINPGAYSHTSIAIRDAIAGVSVPVVEVHISNIFGREQFRHRSYLTPVCVGSIVGLGYLGYVLALEYFVLSSSFPTL